MDNFDLEFDLQDLGQDVTTGPNYPRVYSHAKALGILKRFLQDSVSVQDAAAEILTMLPHHQQPPETNDTEAFGQFLIVVAEQIPFADRRQAKLVNLVQAVAVSPQLVAEGSHANGTKYYCVMPEFKKVLKDNSLPDFLFEHEPPKPEEVRRDLNRVAFIARLYQRGVLTSTDIRFAIKILSESLELKLDSDKVASDTMISLGALWIIVAGQSTFVDVVEAPAVLGVNVRDELGEDPGKLYKGPDLSRERWTFWKQALKTASEDEKAGDEVRSLSGKAVALMDVIEHNMSF